MQCRFCLYENPEDEERCHRCHKRLNGDITFDGVSLQGATALAPRRSTAVLDTTSEGAAVSPGRRAARAAIAAVSDRQTSLFSGELSSNVIPFESLPKPVASASAAANPIATSSNNAVNVDPGPTAKHLAKQTIRKQASNRRTVDSHISDVQGSLNLLPAPHSPRILKTTVEASIYCDAGVATPIHRLIASSLDAAMILIGCGLFVALFQSFGGNIRIDKFTISIFIGAVVLITMFYGLLFAISGRETAGQSWTNLRLINFDGFPPDGSSRALRFAGSWLSFCACGIGILWALLDEEFLTWHDHMSKTFLTMREADSSFFRERPR
jgi:uncharacterized RDD family membrane protein YckC